MRTSRRPVVLRVFDELASARRGPVVVLSAVLVLLVGVADYTTGSDLAFAAFYLPPILMVSATAGRAPLFVVPLLAAVAWAVADVTARSHDYSSPLLPLWNTGTRFVTFLLVAHLAAALRKTVAEERMLSSTDAMTGLANRRSFYARLDDELNRQRRSGAPTTIAYLDVDNFKWVNDNKGHEAGDELLRAVADVLRGRVRVSDVAARLGGDEFAILLPDTTDVGAMTALASLRKHLLAAAEDGGWPVTFSIGAVTFVEAPASVDEAVKAADTAMYSVKQQGKDDVRCTVVTGKRPRPAVV